MKTTMNLTFIGDVMLGRRVSGTVNPGIFKHVKGIFKDSDFVVANLEAVFCKNPVYLEDKKHVFSADPAYLEVLQDSGIGLFSLANNHIIDCGDDGLHEHLDNLSESGFAHFGINLEGDVAQKPHIVKINGSKIGFLAYCKRRNMHHRHGIKPYLISENTVKDVENAAKQVDFLFVLPHWGREYKPHNEYQKNLARAWIDAGASGIIGHHSHLVGEIEYYNGKIIAYSLGNFIFDQFWSEKTRKGSILELQIDENGSFKHKIIETYINDSFEPVII